MSHQAVRDFIRDTVLNTRDDLPFYYARESDFNAIKDKSSKFKVLLLPLQFDPQAVNYTTNRKYRITMLFYGLDSMQGAEEETQEILDQTDRILTEFRAILNKSIDEEDSELYLSTDMIEIENEMVKERIKFTSDNVTGWEYSFNLLVPDQFDYCTIYNSDIS